MAVTSSPVPVRIGLSSDWTTVTAGANHVVATKANGDAYAWGNNLAYQLGYTSPSFQAVPTLVPGGRSFTQVAAGTTFSMGMTAEGDVFEWGRLRREPGDGDAARAPRRASRARTRASRPSCATDRYGRGGLNHCAQLGLGDSEDRTTPSRVGTGTDWASACVGWTHGVGVTTGGELWAWGLDNYGNLGDGGTAQVFAPIRIGSSTAWTDAFAVEWRTLALQGDVLYGWGDNWRGYLGNLGDASPNVPTICGTGWQPYSAAVEYTFPISTDMTVTAPMFYRMSDGYLYWDSDDIYIDLTPPVGGITIGDGAAVTATTAVTFKHTVTQATKMRISGGSWEPLPPVGTSIPATLTSGDGTKTLSVEFADDIGQSIMATDTIELDTVAPTGTMSLNGGAPVTRATRVMVDSSITGAATMRVPDAPWSDLAARNTHSLGIRSDGTLWAWGEGGSGQLGTGGNSHLSPTQVGRDSDWTTVTAGWWHSAALKSDGSLWTWGENSYGALGTGGTASKPYPTRILPGTVWTAVSAGAGHTVALKADGSLWAWGANALRPGRQQQLQPRVHAGEDRRHRHVQGGLRDQLRHVRDQVRRHLVGVGLQQRRSGRRRDADEPFGAGTDRGSGHVGRRIGRRRARAGDQGGRHAVGVGRRPTTRSGARSRSR